MRGEILAIGIEAVDSWGNWTNRRLAGQAIYLLEMGLVEATSADGEVMRGIKVVYENWKKSTDNGQRKLRSRNHDMVSRFDLSTKALEKLGPGETFEHKLMCVNYKASLIFSRDNDGVFSVSLSQRVDE